MKVDQYIKRNTSVSEVVSSDLGDSPMCSMASYGSSANCVPENIPKNDSIMHSMFRNDPWPVIHMTLVLR